MPVQNILIEFTSDASGLQPGIDGIQQLTGIDKALATAFLNTNNALKQRSALIDTNNTSLARFVQNMLNAQKAAVGDTYSKVLTDIRKQLNLADTDAKQFYQDIISGARAAIISSDNVEEIQNFENLIANLSAEIKNLPSVTIPVKLDTTSVPAEIENVETKIKEQPPATIPVNVTFSEAEVQAALANLNNQLGSKTFNFEGLQAATTQAKEILPTLQQDSEAYKQLSASILTAEQSLQTFSQNQLGVNELIDQFKAALTSGDFGKIDFGKVDLTSFGNAKTLIEGLRNEFGLTDIELKKFLTDITTFGRQSIIGNQNTQEVANITALINEADVAMQGLGNAEDGVGVKTTRATTLLRNMRQELLVMEETGQTFSKTFGLSFDQLSIKAAKLQDNIGDTQQRISQMASDTFPLDALIGSLTGVAAGFNIAGGAAILFGGDQQDVQQAILNVQAAMQLLNGLQAISNILVDQSVVKTGAQALVKKLFGTATKEAAAAQQVENVALAEGTVAQEGLNVAMEANPIGIVIGAIALLAAAIGTYAVVSNRANEAEESRRKTLEATAEAEAKAADSIAKEQSNLSVLLVTAQDKALTDHERQQAIEDINKQYPEYLSSLTLENQYTRQSAELIANQITLLKERAFVQAAQDLYTDKLKKVAEAEADLNKTTAAGAGYFEKLKAEFFNLGDALTGTSAQELAVQEATDKVTDANKDADISLGVLKTGIENVSKTMQGTGGSFEGFINNINNVSRAALGLPTVDVKIKAFDPAEFDARKQAALAEQQYELNLTEKGSIAELNAKRKYAQIEFNEDIARFNAAHANDFALTDKAQQEKQAILKKYSDATFDIDQQLRDRNFKSEIANAQALVLQQQALGKESSQAYFDARRQVLIKTAQQELSQENITAGEIKKIRAQLSLDLHNLDVERENKSLEVQKTLTQDRLDLAEKGSAEEMNAEVAILEIEKQIQINNAKGNAAAIQEINDNFRKQELDKILAFNQKVKQEADSTAIADTQHKISELQLQGAQETDDALIELKKELIDQQAQLEIDSIPLSGITEEKRRDLIRAIYDKELEDKRTLEFSKAQSEIENQQTDFSDQVGIERLKNQELLAEHKISLSQFRAADRNFNDETIANNQQLINEWVALQNQYPEKYDEIQKKINELLKENIDIRLSEEQAAEQRRGEILDKSFGLGATIVSGYFANLQAQYQNDLATVQALADKKLITEQELARRKAAINKKQATADKENALFQIAITTAQNIVKDHLNPVLIALDIAVGLAQAAIVLSKPTPAFKTGVIRLQGEGTETSDSIHARLSKGESVITAKATRSASVVDIGDKQLYVKHEEALRAMNEGNFAPYLKSLIPEFEMPVFASPVYQAPVTVMQDMPKWVDRHFTRERITTRELTTMLDVEKMGHTFGRHVRDAFKEMPSYEWNIDNDGIAQIMIYKHQRTEFLNKKFSSKG